MSGWCHARHCQQHWKQPTVYCLAQGLFNKPKVWAGILTANPSIINWQSTRTNWATAPSLKKWSIEKMNRQYPLETHQHFAFVPHLALHHVNPSNDRWLRLVQETRRATWNTRWSCQSRHWRESVWIKPAWVYRWVWGVWNLWAFAPYKWMRSVEPNRQSVSLCGAPGVTRSAPTPHQRRRQLHVLSFHLGSHVIAGVLFFLVPNHQQVNVHLQLDWTGFVTFLGGFKWSFHHSDTVIGSCRGTDEVDDHMQKDAELRWRRRRVIFTILSKMTVASERS